MAAGFNLNPEAHLAERLILGLEAGIAAGGEAGPVHSAALIVTDKMPFYMVDLRVDWDEKKSSRPVAETLAGLRTTNAGLPEPRYQSHCSAELWCSW